jgi:hypothetical protein
MVKKQAKKTMAMKSGPRTVNTWDDVKTAVLLVSLGINVAIFIGWVALRVTTEYDQQVFNFLFVR